MKIFPSSTYTDLIEHRIIPAGGKAAHHARPTMNRRAIITKSAQAD
jgi:hypothetical protein